MSRAATPTDGATPRSSSRGAQLVARTKSTASSASAAAAAGASGRGRQRAPSNGGVAEHGRAASLNPLNVHAATSTVASSSPSSASSSAARRRPTSSEGEQLAMLLAGVANGADAERKSPGGGGRKRKNSSTPSREQDALSEATDSTPALFSSATYRRDPLATQSSTLFHAPVASPAGVHALSSADVRALFPPRSVAAQSPQRPVHIIDGEGDETEDDDPRDQSYVDEDDDAEEEDCTVATGGSRKRRKRGPTVKLEPADEEEDADGDTAMDHDLKDESASVGGESCRSAGMLALGRLKQEPMTFHPLNHRPWMRGFLAAAGGGGGKGLLGLGVESVMWNRRNSQVTVTPADAASTSEITIKKEDEPTTGVPPQAQPNSASRFAPPALQHALLHPAFHRAMHSQYVYSPLQSWVMRGHCGVLASTGGTTLSTTLQLPSTLSGGISNPASASSPFHSPSDSFSSSLSSHLGIPLASLPSQMTRREWTAARRTVGLPRRAGGRWMKEERERVRAEVEKARMAQVRKLQAEGDAMRKAVLTAATTANAEAHGKVGSGSGRPRPVGHTGTPMDIDASVPPAAASSSAPPDNIPPFLTLGTVVYAPHPRGQLASARVIYPRLIRPALHGSDPSLPTTSSSSVLGYVLKFTDSSSRNATVTIPEEEIVLAPAAEQTALSPAQQQHLESLLPNTATGHPPSSSPDDLPPSSAPFLHSSLDRSLLTRLLELIDRKKLLLEHLKRQNETQEMIRQAAGGGTGASGGAAGTGGASADAGIVRTTGASSASAGASIISETRPRVVIDPPRRQATRPDDPMEVDSVLMVPTPAAAAAGTFSPGVESIAIRPIPSSPEVASSSSPVAASSSASPPFTLSSSQLSIAWSLFQKQYAYTVLQLEATTAEMHRVQAQLRARKGQARRSTAALLNSGSGGSSSRLAAPGSGGGASHMIAVRPHGAAPLTHSDRAFLRAHRHSTDGPESLSELSSEARALISAEWADLMRKRKFAKGKEASGGWSAGWDGPPGERLKELAANCVALLILMQRCSDEGRVPREEDFDLLLRNLRPKHHVNEQAYESICESTTTIYRELVRAHASSANGGAAH